MVHMCGRPIKNVDSIIEITMGATPKALTTVLKAFKFTSTFNRVK